jgi:hypothetical protein
MRATLLALAIAFAALAGAEPLAGVAAVIVVAVATYYRNK